MSKFEIKMPKLGESITEGTIMKWSVKKGDVINEDRQKKKILLGVRC